MPTILRTVIARSPLYQVQPKRRLRFELLENGAVTADAKLAYLMAGPASTIAIAYAATAHLSIEQEFLASAVDGPRLLLGVNPQTGQTSTAKVVNISQDGVIELDLQSTPTTVPATAAVEVKIEGVPGNRDVVAIEQPDGMPWRVAGQGRTTNGQLSLQLSVATSEVFIVVPDDFGTTFAPSAAVVVGDRVRPAGTFAGTIYEVTADGELPAEEPIWWAPEDDAGPRALGTAMVKAVYLHRPKVHGPIQPTITG